MSINNLAIHSLHLSRIFSHGFSGVFSKTSFLCRPSFSFSTFYFLASLGSVLEPLICVSTRALSNRYWNYRFYADETLDINVVLSVQIRILGHQPVLVMGFTLMTHCLSNVHKQNYCQYSMYHLIPSFHQRSLSSRDRKSSCNSLVTCRLDYCSFLFWFGSSVSGSEILFAISTTCLEI